MTDSKPPCSVVSWAKAHGKYVCGPTHTGAWGHCTDASPLPHPRWSPAGPIAVPAHSSDAWLAGMVRAVLAHAGEIRGCEDGHVHVQFRPRTPYIEMNFNVLHAAICRAVEPEGGHTCQ